MEKYINILKGKPFSGSDIMNTLDGKTKIIKNSDMWKYENIDEILHPFNCAVILYQTRPDYGHWVCILKHPDNTLEFFDPYGFSIDGALKFINPQFRKESRQDFPQLIRLFLNSPYNIKVNKMKIQKYNKKISTCGRHCAFRLVLKHLPLEEYQKIMKPEREEMDADDKVTYLMAYID